MGAAIAIIVVVFGPLESVAGISGVDFTFNPHAMTQDHTRSVWPNKPCTIKATLRGLITNLFFTPLDHFVSQRFRCRGCGDHATGLTKLPSILQETSPERQSVKGDMRRQDPE